jgi:hypothetical protein
LFVAAVNDRRICSSAVIDRRYKGPIEVSRDNCVIFRKMIDVKTVYIVFAVLGSIVLATSGRAELKWEQTTIELQPALGDKQAIAHFKYQNVGEAPIHFKSVRASCGCTAAQSQKDNVPPGEKGEITATFNIGDRTGAQVKTVSVETDDTAHAMTVLTLKANIPQLLELQPNFVFWQSGEEGKAKTVVARAGKDVPIKNLEVTSTNPDFTAKVEHGSAPGEFRIDIQPRDTKKPGFASLMVKPDYPKDAPKTFYVTARVTPPNITPAPAPASASR